EQDVGEEGVKRTQPVAINMQVLFGNAPKMQRTTQRIMPLNTALKISDIEINEALFRVLHHPTVADKSFLITIGDRSITALVHRDQMVGPWQVPVADAGVLLRDYQGYAGEAIAIGERPPLALINPQASARMAVAEALTNLLGVPLSARQDIRLSANWMAAVNSPGEDAALFDAVHAVATQLCIKLGISIPVGKDSLSMSVAWKDEQGQKCEVVSPLSLVITAFAPVRDVRCCVTPQLMEVDTGTSLYLLDLGAGQQRLGASILAQVYQQLGDCSPDVEDVDLLRSGFDFIQECLVQQWLLACHDRADGGLITTLCEMTFAGHCGLDVDLSTLGKDPLPVLFNEELGVVLQVRQRDRDAFLRAAAHGGLKTNLHWLGTATIASTIRVRHRGSTILQVPRVMLQRAWSETSWRMQQLRDHPDCALQDYNRVLDTEDPGLHAHLTFDPGTVIACPVINRGVAPKVAILREQGINGHLEMARAFHEAGFVTEDVTMTDLVTGRRNLNLYQGLAACGGFSYGDVLGAGLGSANSVLFNDLLRQQFALFFEDTSHFALGVCNGCQMLSGLRELIPGTAYWPDFVRNRSEQFEARTVMVEIPASTSLFFKGMYGSRLPVAVAHGEGRVRFREYAPECLTSHQQIALQYVDHYAQVTEAYPFNPNGSQRGITGLCNEDGRILIMMPHPERVIRSVSMSWKPSTFSEFSPWLQLFHNARLWLV
ncbi:MAG TPA: phosphoribosylformylglycinamidine synthase, partial [Gammaproteobacteria bacterium]|nr:phosphoribosylformylglycinamidine synthase [Gammaproteobacteria bacterium]